jgi:(5-formylfuran-3-yl)methyl phosphate synthase
LEIDVKTSMINGLIGAGAGFRPMFLAGVLEAAEADLALQAGGQLIDCKNPSAGALGALDAITIRSVVARVAGRAPVSATIGDLPCHGAVMVTAARTIAATGVDIVKVGFFGDGDPRDAIAALGKAGLGKARLVAVMMADRAPDFSVIADLAKANFIGVMLDTADKASGALPDVLDHKTLADFVARARSNGLASGLAGSLRIEHIAGLVALQPDIIGFRGALCFGGRTNALDAARAKAVRAALDTAIAGLENLKRSVA